MDILAVVGLIVCYVVQRHIRPLSIALPASIVVTLVSWVLVAFALSQVSPHPLVPAGAFGYAITVGLAVAIAFFVAAARYFVARRRKGAQP